MKLFSAHHTVALIPPRPHCESVLTAGSPRQCEAAAAGGCGAAAGPPSPAPPAAGRPRRLSGSL